MISTVSAPVVTEVSAPSDVRRGRIGEELELAEWWPASPTRRAMAALLDEFAVIVTGVLAGVVVTWVAKLLDSRLVSLGLVAGYLSGLAVWTFNIVLTGLCGQSLGKMLFRLRVVRVDGKPCGMVRALVRCAVFPVAVTALGHLCEMISPLLACVVWCALWFVDGVLVFDTLGRRLVDYVAGTKVMENVLPSGMGSTSVLSQSGVAAT